mgnify:CR=1 FL=1
MNADGNVPASLLKLHDDLRHALEHLLRQEIRVLVTGFRGSGKSTLINLLVVRTSESPGLSVRVLGSLLLCCGLLR